MEKTPSSWNTARFCLAWLAGNFRPSQATGIEAHIKATKAGHRLKVIARNEEEQVSRMLMHFGEDGTITGVQFKHPEANYVLTMGDCGTVRYSTVGELRVDRLRYLTIRASMPQIIETWLASMPPDRPDLLPEQDHKTVGWILDRTEIPTEAVQYGTTDGNGRLLLLNGIAPGWGREYLRGFTWDELDLDQVRRLAFQHLNYRDPLAN